MDYRMYDKGAKKDENIVPLIKKAIRDSGQKFNGEIKFIGFIGETGTEFYLNSHEDSIQIPECGYFISPYSAEYYMPIYNLKFKNDFSKNIYYII